jgi:hypothetical protein
VTKWQGVDIFSPYGSNKGDGLSRRNTLVRILVASLLVCLWLPAGTSWASPAEPQDPSEVDPPPTEPAEQGEDGFELFPDEAPDLSDEELRSQGEDPCALNEEGNWVDWLNRTVTSSVCGSSRWFDSFFGTQNEFETRQSTFGRLGLGTYWDEDDGFDPEFRFRARLNFPNANNRFHAVMGRGSVDEVLDGEDTSSPAEDFFDEESEWLVGFGYNLNLGGRSRLSPSVGTSWSSGLDPYVRLRYVYQVSNSERGQFRIKITPYWQETKGLGYTFRPGYDLTLGEKFMVRGDISIKDFEEKIGGFSYGLYLYLFHKLNPRNALRYKVGLFSQSDLEQQPQDVGGGVSWRTTVYKELLVVESAIGTTFRRRPGGREREPELILGLVFELKFGR